MEYIFNHAREIAYLCFGGGFLILIGFAIIPLVRIARILKKMDDVSDLFVAYLEKPLRVFLQVREILSGLSGFFGKK